MDKKVIVRLENISKSFEDTEVIQPMDLDIYEGEFLTLLGPSGCGKTTTLRMIGGFEQPTGGRVLLEDKDVTALPPYKRNVNTVFQSYALFPHMTVFDNVAYGLVEKKKSKAEIFETVTRMLELVQMGKMEKRKPSQLSGGQKQRVAIARALANDPKVLLLDEPLGALDLKLRKQMQLELKSLQKRLGITFVYVTHDQEEALTMSDRIIVMNKGRLEQVGSSREIYEHPKTRFVADFIGESNIFEASVLNTEDGIVNLLMENGHVKAAGQGFRPDEIVYLCVRPENVVVSEAAVPGFNLKGYVTDIVFVGSVVKVVVELPNRNKVKFNLHPAAEMPRVGSLVNISWQPDKAVIMHTAEDSLYDAIEACSRILFKGEASGNES